MSDFTLSYDTVADGYRTRPRWFTILGVGAMLTFASAEVFIGNYMEAVESAMFAAWIYIADKSHRSGWIKGYTSAVVSTFNQLGVDRDVEVDTDE